MKSFLFPNSFRLPGLILLIISVPLGLYTLFTDFEPAFFEVRVPSIFIDEIIGDKKLIGMVNTNVLNEVLGVAAMIGGLLVAFSREKQEDEFIAKIRLESLLKATYFNYGILLIAMLFIFDLSFIWVLIFNMYTILLFFILFYNLQMRKLKVADYAE